MYVNSRISSLGQVPAQLVEQRVGDPTVVTAQRIGVRKHGTLGRRPAIGDRPRRDRVDLFVAEADVAASPCSAG